MRHRTIYLTVTFILIAAIGSLSADENRGSSINRLKAESLADQGNQLIVQARQTGDDDLYEEARMLFENSLQLSSNNITALNGLGIIALNRHHFPKALLLAKKSLAINDFQPAAYGVLIDALIELGQYPQALEAAEKMISIRPDNAALTRVSYLRELHGDLTGAIAALQKALQFGFDTPEGSSWCQMQTGKLFLLQGKLPEAERSFRQALELHPQFGVAASGLAKALSLRGKNRDALYFAVQAAEIEPIGENIVALAKILQDNGFEQLATEQVQKAITLIRSEKTNGMAVNDELAALLTDWEIDQQEALLLAKEAYDDRPTVNIAHLLARVYLRLGNLQQAASFAEKSLKLNTQYSHFYYISGKIHYQLGQHPALAKEHLAKAITINPFFSRQERRDAQALLAELKIRY